MKARFILTLATMLFLAACAAPSPSPFTLSGTNWALVSITQNGAPKPPVAGTNVTLDFSREGRVSGNSGCNSYGGGYETQGEILKINALFVTLMACVETEKMELEAAYLAGLQGAQLFERRADRLTITFANGNGKLEFTPR